MKKFRFFSVLTLIVAFLFTSASPLSADYKVPETVLETHDVQENTTASISPLLEKYVMESVNSDNNVLQPFALSGIVVFVGGIIIGWIIDGVIIHATGYSGGEWAAMGINAAADIAAGLWKGATKLFMNRTTRKVSYAKNANDCIKSDPKGTSFLCPMRLEYEF